MTVASALSGLASGVARTTAAVALVDASAGRASAAAGRFRVVASFTLPSRFVPRGEGTLGPFDRPLSAIGGFDRGPSAAFDFRDTGGFDRTTAVDLAHIGAMERFVAMMAQMFEFRATGGFDRAPSSAFQFRDTGGFDRD